MIQQRSWLAPAGGDRGGQSCSASGASIASAAPPSLQRTACRESAATIRRPALDGRPTVARSWIGRSSRARSCFGSGARLRREVVRCLALVSHHPVRLPDQVRREQTLNESCLLDHAPAGGRGALVLRNVCASLRANGERGPESRSRWVLSRRQRLGTRDSTEQQCGKDPDEL